MDPCSFTNSDAFTTTNVHFEWKINFEKGVLEGTVELQCSVSKATRQFIFDTRFLEIRGVCINREEATYSLGELHPAKGQALVLTARVRKKL